MSLAATVTRAATARKTAKRAPLKSRRPTGKPPWPLILLAGGEKAGKSYSAALASASQYVGRTFWIGVGEDDPDEYGAIPGADFEILEHDGTYLDIASQIDAAAAEPWTDGKPNMIVLDSGSRLWDMLSEEAQAIATQRKENKERKFNRASDGEDAPISMDLWNRATKRWNQIMDLLRSHNGPVLITARLETVTVMDDNGKPTTEKTSKVKGQKGLPFDVGVVIQMPKRGEVYVTGVRSIKYNVAPGELVPFKDFSVENMWKALGVLEEGATSERRHSGGDGHASAQREDDWITLFNDAKGDVTKLQELKAKAEEAGLSADFGMFRAIEIEMAEIATKSDEA